MNRRALICLLGLVMLAGTSPAQENSKRTPSGFWAFGGLYGGLFGFDNLNSRLAGAPFYFEKELSGTHLMYGGGGMSLSGNVTTAGYGFGGRQIIHSESLGIDLSADYSGGMFELGWVPVTLPSFMIGPALGIGGAGFTLRAARAGDYVPDLDSMLKNGAQSWEVSNERFVLAPALNIMIPIAFTGLGIKVGYFWAPFEKNWQMGSRKITSAPDLKASGPFATVHLLLGGSSRGEAPEPKQNPAEIKAEDDRRRENRSEEELRRQEELKRQQEQLNESPKPTEEQKKLEEEKRGEEEKKREEEGRK